MKRDPAGELLLTFRHEIPPRVVTTIITRPQVEFRPRRLVYSGPRDTFLILDVRFGYTSMFASSGEIPADAFTLPDEKTIRKLKTLAFPERWIEKLVDNFVLPCYSHVGMDVSLVVQSITDEKATFAAFMYGSDPSVELEKMKTEAAGAYFLDVLSHRKWPGGAPVTIDEAGVPINELGECSGCGSSAPAEHLARCPALAVRNRLVGAVTAPIEYVKDDGGGYEAPAELKKLAERARRRLESYCAACHHETALHGEDEESYCRVLECKCLEFRLEPPPDLSGAREQAAHLARGRKKDD